VEVNMSLHPEPIGEIPGETARVARAAFPKGTLVTRLRDEFSVIYQDEDFGGLYPDQGQPALTPWRLARFSHRAGGCSVEWWLGGRPLPERGYMASSMVWFGRTASSPYSAR
jgi:hypothetical protein